MCSMRMEKWELLEWRIEMKFTFKNGREVEATLMRTYDRLALVLDDVFVVGITPDGRVRLNTVYEFNRMDDILQLEPIADDAQAGSTVKVINATDYAHGN